jgi:cell volume regulation protein A
VQAATFHAVLPFLSAFALIFVLFDAGLGLDLRGTALGFTRSVFLGVVGMIVCSVAVAGVAVLFDFSWIEGLLLGTIVSGTSSVTVIALAEKLPISASAKTVLTLESVLSDPLVIVVPLTLIGAVAPTAQTAPSNVDAAQMVMATFSIGAVVGLTGGFTWGWFLARLPDRGLEYVLTLATLFAIYVVCELLGGSGAIAALLFGLVLANGPKFGHLFQSGSFDLGRTDVREFHGELAFFIRSFFMVFLGVIASFRREPLLLGAAIVVAAGLARVVGVYVGTAGMGLAGVDKRGMSAIFPRGLAAAVVAHIASERAVPHADVLIDVVVVVILGTTVVSTLAAAAVGYSARRAEAA